MNPKGYFLLQLHAHLPFVRHPEYPDFLEEDWFFEAVIETYIPLLLMMERFLDEGVDFGISMSVTPPLASMLNDPLLQSRCYFRICSLLELANKEIHRTKNLPQFAAVAKMYAVDLQNAKNYWEKYHGNLIEGFKKIQATGKLEIITCGATHGFLPLKINKTSARAQVRAAVNEHERLFGMRPKGIWLPECAYADGVDADLKKEGINFFFLEAHGILYATPRPKYGVFAPVYTPSGVAAFGRDLETAQQVWSAETGYPGDPDYREFYRDLGYDLDYDYIRPYLHSDGVRRNTGMKYYRITGKVPLSAKEPYNPDWAMQKAASHAGNFMFNRQKQIEHLSDVMDRPPVVVSMYDAELFGHWWFEGPKFIEYLFRKIHYDQDTFKTITPSKYLEMFPKNQVCSPAASSWGDKGYYEVWLNGTNDWIYRHLHKAADRMVELAKENQNPCQLSTRALNQAARELLLAESSDWAFIMTTGTMVEYAEKRTKDHLINFTKLYDALKNNSIDNSFLSYLEQKNNIFPTIDFRIYRD